MLTFSCATGQAFDVQTLRCEPASTVNCIETISESVHHLHKREVFEVHTIDFNRFKEKVIEAFRQMTPILEDLAADVVPFIYDKFVATYLPTIKNFRDEVLPFFYAKIYPQVQKYFRFSLKISGKLIEKAYRSFELSNSTHLAIVSLTDLTDEVYNEIQPVLKIAKFLSGTAMTRGHYEGKRESLQLPENFPDAGKYEKVHFIDIHKLRNKLIEFFQSIKPLLNDLIAKISPSIYEEFNLTYLPIFNEIKDSMQPFFSGKSSPQTQKYLKIAQTIAEKVIKRTYKSYELSNSTHISVVSLSGVIDEVYSEIKPILDLARFLSGTLKSNGHPRGKREAPEMSETTLVRNKRQMPDMLFTLVSPFMENFFNSMTSTLFGGSESLLSKVVLPVFYDILGDPESRYDAMTVYMIAKSTFSPLVWEMMKRQTYDTPEGTVIKIPKHLYLAAMKKFVTEARPIVRKLMSKHISSVFRNLQDNSAKFVDFLETLMFEKYDGADVFKDQIFSFANKHRNMFKTSTNTHVHFYPLNEIMRDMQPIKVSAVSLFVQYLRRTPDSWLNMVFGEGSLIQRTFMGTPTYAKPHTTSSPHRPLSPVSQHISRPKLQTRSG